MEGSGARSPPSVPPAAHFHLVRISFCYSRQLGSQAGDNLWTLEKEALAGRAHRPHSAEMGLVFSSVASDLLSIKEQTFAFVEVRL